MQLVVQFVKSTVEKLKLSIEKKLKNPDPLWIFFSFPFQFVFRIAIYLKKLKRKKISQTNTTICVGNITIGGNGKTPFLIFLADQLKKYHPMILSKGYGRSSTGDLCVELSSDFKEVGDEPLLIKSTLPEFLVYVTDSRKGFLDKIHNRFCILDDGLQDSKMKFDFNLCLFDKNVLSKKQYLIPTGILREPFDSLKNIDLIAIKGSVEQKEFESLQKMFKKPLLTFDMKVKEFVGFNHQKFILTDPTAFFCAIGNPESFKETLIKQNVNIKDQLIFIDHAKLDCDKLEVWINKCLSSGVKQIVCTKKDAIKLRSVKNYKLPIFFLETEIQIENGKEQFDLFVDQVGTFLETKSIIKR